MTILGLLDGARSRDVLVGNILLALLLAGTSDGNEGCGNTPDDSQMMSVLKQAADMFMPCIEALYHTPMHGSILEQAVQGICRNYDKCNEATIKDFPYEPSMMAQKSVGCMMSSKTVPREKQRLFAALHWLLLLLK
ncbi:uncharacterized protein [Dermacentor andersoni]|uniref:uncharacterized protein isoform X2 n=1 Tax=Dermacentor andersoni TaxID=34620 RepID=UPI002155DFC8|nr:uncharacterized protein LOC126545361 isoform X2 [Dermacentor andersoni]